MKSKNLLFPIASARVYPGLFVALTACVFLCPSARGEIFTYSKNDSNTPSGTNWSEGTNWSLVPVSASATTLVFNGALADGVAIFSNNDISGNFKLNQMEFTHTGPDAGTVPTISISGNPLEFVRASNDPDLIFGTIGTIKPAVIIHNNLVLTNNLIISVNSPGTLDGIISGSGNLKKDTGLTQTLMLTGENSYTGITTVSSGTLAGVGEHAFGSTSVINVAGSGFLSLRGDTSTSFVKASDGTPYAVTTTADGATINADQATSAGIAAKTMSFGTLKLNAAKDNQTHFTGANNTSLSIGAVTTGTSASGTETLDNSNAGGGCLTLASIAVSRTGASTLKFDGAGHTIVSGEITEVVPTALNKSGTGMLTLNGNCGLTGATNVNKGTLHLIGSLDSTVVVKNTGTLSGTGSISGNISVASGGHLAFAVAENSAVQNPLNINGTLTLDSGNFIDLSIESTAPANGEYILASATGITYNLTSTVYFGGITGTVSVKGNNLVLTVTGSTATYENWATSTHGLSGGNAEFDFDFDHDGIDNGLEWILGGNPKTGALSGNPKAVRDASNNLVLTFTREEDAIAKTSLILEYGTSLADWISFTIDADGGTDSHGVVAVINQAAEPDTCTITIPSVIAAERGRIFARLKAVKSP